MVKDLIILGCSSQQPTRRRNQGGYLVRWNNEGFLFDPGEGTQRQFIFAGVAPTCITRIFISHFHGDHCLGVGSMLMRLNLDKIPHPVHCYYPKSGAKNFERLRKGCYYHERIQVVEHQIAEEGVVAEDSQFIIAAMALDHGVTNFAYRIEEKPRLKFKKEIIQKLGLKGPIVGELEKKKKISWQGKTIHLKDVSYEKPGDVFVYISDTKYMDTLASFAKGATLLLSESTYLESEKELAARYQHMTAKQAGHIAKEAQAKQLILTHFSARYPEESAFEKEAREIFPHSNAASDLKRFDFPL
jgi:ribonuclease Z